MGLLCMTKFVKHEGLMSSYQLRDSKLIVDGNCCGKWIYYNTEEDPAIGGDYEDLAKYIKQLFTNLKDCNVSCYVLFDSGHNAQSMQKKLERIGKDQKNLWFVTAIMVNILDELKIPHATCCTDEADDTIVALAKFFNCPVLSNDSDFFLSPVPVISFNSCLLVSGDHFVKCDIFKRDILLQKYRLREDMLPILSMLLQTHYFEFQQFQQFMIMSKITRHVYHRINAILIWLSSRTYETAVSLILNNVPVEDQQKCNKFLQYSKKTIFGAQTESYAFRFLVDFAAVTVKENDPEWFEKGVLLSHISKPYVDMYKNKIYTSCPEDTFIPCLRILRYAFDLLTGFSGEEFQYASKCCRRMISKEFSIGEPDRGLKVPFASGWSFLPDYFEHFVSETLPGLPSAAIDELPSDCRLWLLALVWWTMHAARDAPAEVHCLLLCRARVAGHFDDEEEMRKLGRTDAVLSQKTPQAFDQFQNILNQLDCLNRLCSAPYDPIRYSESYCDSLARGALTKMKDGAEPRAFAVECLQKSDTAYELYKKLFSTYEHCVASVTASQYGMRSAITTLPAY